ncbi:MAG: O-antigen ligase family protein [Verrucomicrobiae bacterium]|nr:O-antigen ligase family protein [Verrucomicrobiae bacterium]
MKSTRNNLLLYGLLGCVGLFVLLECFCHLPLAQPSLAGLREDLLGVVLLKSGQLMLVTGFTLWLMALLHISRQQPEPTLGPRISKAFASAHPWKALLAICSLFTYAFYWHESPITFDRHFFMLGIDQSTNILVLLVGLVFSQVFEIVASSPPARFSNFCGRTLVFFVLFFCAASLMQLHLSHVYGYQGQIRWTGLWVNPNIYGILMGTGSVLVVGLSVWKRREGRRCWESEKVEMRKRKKAVFWRLGAGKFVIVISCLGAVGLLGLGLLHSYSRGAWIGTFLGFVFLVWRARSKEGEAGSAGIKANLVSGASLGRHYAGSWWLQVSVILASVFVLGFWHFRGTAWQPARRIFSVTKTEDFSWRNRAAGWEGAMQIAAEHPWFGAGWYQVEPIYENYYLSARLTEGAAIEMNDYLMLGATLGMPALFCFGMYLWLSFAGKPGHGNLELERTEAEWLKIVCRAGTIVLLVGFWFDGGLFKLPTAVTFWILLELGSVQPRRMDTND